VENADLQVGMTQLHLHQAARTMMPEVRFILAIPILQPEASHYAPSPVAAILYLDSRDDDFFLDGDQVQEHCDILKTAARSIVAPSGAALGRLRNVQLEPVRQTPREPATASTGTSALEILGKVEAPLVTREFVLNFDHTDLAPATTDATTPAGA
jgi:hypothetical protein